MSVFLSGFIGNESEQGTNKSPAWAGWSSGNTLAYHTADPGSIPGWGGLSEKFESVWGDFSSPACHPPSLHDTGVYKRDWWRRANYLCWHCFQCPQNSWPAGQICDRSDLPHFQPDRNVRCCFQYYVYSRVRQI